MTRPDTNSLDELIPPGVQTYCPHLSDKMLVDFANGLAVARTKIRFQKDHSGFLARTWGGVTGTSARRQQQINMHLADGLEASLGWLADLTERTARTDLAVRALEQCLETFAGKLASTRNAVVALDRARQAMQERLGQLDAEVERLDFKDRVNEEIDLVFERWSNGRFAAVAPLGRVVLALDQLYWGQTGRYCRRHPERTQMLRQLIVEKAIRACRGDWRVDASHLDVVFPTRVWLAADADIADGAIDAALMYMGSWADAAHSPLTFSATQWAPDAPPPRRLPLLLSPAQAVERVTEEVFADKRQAPMFLLDSEAAA